MMEVTTTKLSVILSIITVLHSTPSFSNELNPDTTTDVTTLHEILLKQATSFLISSFQSDPELVQEIDKKNHTTIYKFLGEDAILYERSLNDGKKEVVVLTSKEDKIPIKDRKCTYVLFKRNPSSFTYFGEVVFIRPSASENAVVIDDVPSLVEWTPFDDHWIPGRLPVRQFAMSCSSSILASCLFNASVLAENKSTYISSQVPFSQLKIPPKSSMAQLESLVFKSYNDSNITDVNYDCYLDIKLGSMESDTSVLNVTEILGETIKSILCMAAPLLCTLNTSVTTGILPFSGSKEDVVIGRRKRDAISPLSPYNYPGWKTQYMKIAKGSYTSRNPTKFYGFGNCPWNSSFRGDYVFKNSTGSSADDVINYYLTILRVHCISTINTLLKAVVKSGILSLNKAEKKFEVVSDHKYLTQGKLTTGELIHVVTAFEFSVFTEIYVSTINEPRKDNSTIYATSFTTPSGKLCSESISFFTTICLNYLTIVQDKAPLHLIYLTRSMLQNTQAIYFKLVQDSINLAQSCKDCNKDIELNFNDRLQLMALNQFIRKGLSPVEKGKVDVDDAFNEFYKDNESIIEKYVKLYT